MKKIKICLLVIIIILAIILVFMGFGKSSNGFSRSSDSFYDALSLLKEGKYSEAYKLTEGMDSTEDQKTIKNIIAYSYLKNVTNCIDDINKSGDALESAIDQARYSSIYGSVDISEDTQNKIDTQNKEIMQNYGDLNTKFPKESLYEDLENLYNATGQLISSYDGLDSNFKEKLISETERTKYLNDLNTFTEALENESKYIDDVEKAHPLNEIPEQYRIMFELDNNDK